MSKMRKKNSFELFGAIAGGINYQEEGKLPFCYITCKNKECKYDLAKIAGNKLKLYLKKLKAEHPLIAKKVEKVCTKKD